MPCAKVALNSDASVKCVGLAEQPRILGTEGGGRVAEVEENFGGERGEGEGDWLEVGICPAS